MDSITITRDMFNEAVITANKKFASSDKTPSDGKHEMVLFMMELQNIAFGALIGETLFGEKEDK